MTEASLKMQGSQYPKKKKKMQGSRAFPGFGEPSSWNVRPCFFFSFLVLCVRVLNVVIKILLGQVVGSLQPYAFGEVELVLHAGHGK